MSIVDEILESASKVDMDYINKHVPMLMKKVETLENEVGINVEQVYEKNDANKNKTLLIKAVQLNDNLLDLRKKAEFIKDKELENAEQELSSSINQLKMVDFKLQEVQKVEQIMMSLNNFNENVNEGNYFNCVEILQNVKQSIEVISPDGRLDIMDTLAVNIKDTILLFQQKLINIIQKNVDISVKSKTELRIKCPNAEMEEALLAIHSSNEEIEPVRKVARELWNNVFIPIITEDVDLTITEGAPYKYLRIQPKSKEKSNYQTVFNNLKTTLGFLMENLPYKLNDELTALQYIGDDIRDNLSELIIKECLRGTVPSNEDELQKYDVVQEATKELEETFKAAKLFTAETRSLIEYANDVDVMFINKKCEGYSKKAREIMKKDLHNKIEVGVPYYAKEPLDRDHLEFPQCAISKNLVELLDFIERLLTEAVGASPQNAGRLFVTVNNIIFMYRTFVPEFHQNYLASLPQHIALFLNNCLYIQRKLNEWNSTYCLKLRHILDSCDFTQDIALVPRVGFDYFDKFIEGQVRQIKEIMDGAELRGSMLEKLDQKTEKSIRQCLRQQELLRTVWHKVLSYEMYNTKIGIIVNALCENIVASVLKFEDIQTHAAEELVDVIKLVLTRAPKLFINPSEITLFVKQWDKLNEVAFVLNSSLADINDRWADGKGPLALHFEARELKDLIKALFQNTDRRDAVLARITSTSLHKN